MLTSCWVKLIGANLRIQYLLPFPCMFHIVDGSFIQKGLTIISLNVRYASTRQQNAITGVCKVLQNVTHCPEDVIRHLIGCKLIFPESLITLFCCSVFIRWPTSWFLVTNLYLSLEYSPLILRIKSWYLTLIFKVFFSLSKDIAPNTAPRQIFSPPFVFLSILAFAFFT